MRIDIHKLEKFTAHQTHNKGGNHGIKSPLRVAVITNFCVKCGSTFADRSTAQNHVVNSWTRCTCKTDRSHMTWSLEAVTQPISCNLCEQEFGDLQTYYAHARLTRRTCPSQLRRSEGVNMPSLSQDATGNTQELDTSASLGSIMKDGSLVAEAAKSKAAPTNRQPKQARWRGQRLDDCGGQARSRLQGRAEEPQQNHVQGHPQDASDDARPFLDGVGNSADQGVEPRSRQHAETDAGGARTHTRTTTRVGTSGLDQVSSAEGATRLARERHKAYRRTGPDWNPFCRTKSATRFDFAGWSKCTKRTSRKSH